LRAPFRQRFQRGTEAINGRHDQSSVAERIGSVIGTLSLLACVLALSTPARASFPGGNGKLAFTSDPSGSDLEVYAMNADGSGQTDLTNNPNSDSTPSWSPDGQKIAFSTDRDVNDEIYVMNEDGTNPIDLTNNAASDTSPAWSGDGQKLAFTSDRNGTFNLEIYSMNADGSAQTRLTNTADSVLDTGAAWSPDGQKIAFTTTRDGNSEIYVMDANGANQTDLTNNPATDSGADWSPDGQKVAFASRRDGNAEIYVMNADGSNPTRLTTNSTSDFSPAWSPDGQKIAFRSNRDGNGYEIYVMNADGSAQTRLTSNTWLDTDPDWQPVTGGYPRPKGATPLRVSLVPAYQPCTTGNRTHGAPLSFASCAPPRQASGQLTVGTPDSNGEGSNSSGYVLLNAIVGDPSTPADEADVRITTSITDVRNKLGLADYTGAVQVVLNVRLTDRATANEPQTTQDFPFGVTVPCTATIDTTIGSTCSLVTTADTVMPGAVPESKRSIWALDQVRVYDAGPDGDVSTAGDNTLFETQGVFVP
jgi:dipeptidyl aminopeptidase/acylaminoacyl peptidase